MAHFFFKLLPPRPTFVQDMSDEERALMGQHAAYVQGFFDKGCVLAYGPVFAQDGSFGLGLLDMNSMEEAQQFAAGDPTIQARMNTYTLSPMIIAASQASRVNQ